MKKIIFLLIFILVSINTRSQNTYVPDDNFEQLLIDFGYDSGPLDDFVPTNNINSVTELFINDPSIKDFTGLNGFTALTRLGIEVYDVTEIDISKNIKLKDLFISNGLLKIIDVSKNTELETLRLIVVDVSSINLKNNLKLKDLTIGNTSITTLDLSYNRQLLNINLSHGIIENINLKNSNNSNINSFSCVDNAELKCLQVDNKNYSITNWTDIDDTTVYSESCNIFENLTYIPDDNFEQNLIDLGFDSGALDDYVPTQNIDTIREVFLISLNINDATGIEDFEKLEHLQLRDNNVTTLNVSDLEELRVLDFTSNKIDDIDVSNNKNLEFIFCNDNPINNLQISKNDKITRVEIDDTNISSINLENNQLLSIFSCNNTPLKDLDLTKNTVLERLFCDNTLLETINLKNTNNASIIRFSCLNNLKLTCFLVDDKNYSTINWTTIDDASVFTDTACPKIGYTYVPDDNFEQALIDLGFDTLPLDDYVLTNNINTIKNLKIDQLNISDLTGIEDFTALENLNVDTNSLTVLNLDNNNNLTLLSTSNNNISSLDITLNSKLLEINCSNNPLSTLKLPSNNILDNLYVQSTLISELDLRNQAKLISTATSFLEIQNNPNLKCVFVDDVNKFNTDIFSTITKDSSAKFVVNEADCNLISCTINVDILSSLEVLDAYTLPNITNGNYYTKSGGNGIQLSEGTIITTSQIIYIYNQSTVDLLCFAESSFKVTINGCIIPTFFTPNNDSKNDTWQVTCNKTDINSIDIFNRFGKLIKRIQPNTEGWDGNYNTKSTNANTYWYLINFKDGTQKRGYFSLIK
jgi:gliding motility-associated-like protein